jgi:hypothetical protein
MRNNIKVTLQVIISALLGLEVSLSPNIYIKPLIWSLVFYIVLRYNIDKKIMLTMERYLGKK